MKEGFVRDLLHQAVANRLGLPARVAEGKAEAFLGACGQVHPAIAIIDSAATDAKGNDLIRRLLAACPKIHVLVLGQNSGAFLIQRALAEGAKGYVDRSSPLTTVLEAINAVAGGATYICPKSQILLQSPTANPYGLSKGRDLSRRETEVLRAIAEGKMTKQIAAEQGRSIYTIENQRRRILRKTGFSSVAQITLLALELGLIEAKAC